MSDIGAVAIGIICGVLAGIPTSVLVLVALHMRGQAQVARRVAAYQQPQQPAGRPPLCWIIEPGGERTDQPGRLPGAVGLRDE